MTINKKTVAQIEPYTIGAAQLFDSTIVEPAAGETPWAAGTNWVTGTHVLSAHQIWERLAPGGIDAALPETAADKWELVGPSLRYAMFDKATGTATTAASTLTVKIRPGDSVGALLCDELNNVTKATVTVRDAGDATVIYPARVVDLDRTVISDPYDWFVARRQYAPGFVLTDVPEHYVNPEVELTLEGGPTATISCGMCVIGPVTFFGAVQTGMALQLIDYSAKETSRFGRTTIKEGSFSKKMRLRFYANRSDQVHIWSQIVKLRAKFGYYIGCLADGFEIFNVGGFPRDAVIEVPLPKEDVWTLEIDGMTNTGVEE
jgi:hypothetical protein